ncbi:hypothetical protein [Paenibacillus sp. CCS19]|uniref:hypothetical protein n=1 Tax=Paenibacillus sp. CCS19 TaxID=3158387 RepID=UPI00295F4DD9|nr:hypothetical protein [Paenibacillus cellulosilyticus]
MSNNYGIELADKELFAVYQVLYANADIEMWYDWKARLEDTKFTDQCYWIMSEGITIGGAIIMHDTVMYPFTIPPYADRMGSANLLAEQHVHLYMG